MPNLFRNSSVMAVLLLALAASFSTGAVLAQGSAGGSIGNDDKAVSGSRSTTTREAPVRRKQAEEPPPRRSSSRRSGGDGGRSFDGNWVVNASPGCASSGTGQVMISGGRIVGQGISGSISSSGAIRTVGSMNGLTIVSSGRANGSSASGVYRQSDGCSGTWRGMRG